MSAGADALTRARRLGAWEVLRKPFDLAELLDVVQHALRDTDRREGR
jgi:DNA-binding NtrC family response regulator